MAPSESQSSQLARFDQRRRRQHGVVRIGGIDEAGRGPLAGPVVAACVVLGPGTRLAGLDDSKRMTAEAREDLAPLILRSALGWGIGLATHGEIDRINILRATHLAAARAMEMLLDGGRPEYMITDFLKIENAGCPVEPIVKGDARSQAVAAASVLAKVSRDRMMQHFDAEFPQYGFAGHKGYGTQAHLAALRSRGPCAIHRLSFRGVLAEPFFGEEEALLATQVKEAAWPPFELDAGETAKMWRALIEGRCEPSNRLNDVATKGTSSI